MSTVATPLPAASHRPRIVHTRTEVLGLLLMLGAVLFLVVSAIVTGTDIGEAAFFILPITLTAVGAAIAWRYGTWAKITALVLGTGAALTTFWLAFGLTTPAAFVEFTSGAAYVVGVLLMLGGGVAAIVKRHDLRETATRNELIVDRSALAIVALALVVSFALWATQRTTVDAAAASGLPEIGMANFEFDGPATATAVDGQVSLVVRNTDAFVHTFTVDALGVDVTLLPGSSEIIELAAEAGQTIAYYCVPHSSEGGTEEDDMAGTLLIE